MESVTKKPHGWLSKVFGKHAPWWVKALRIPVYAMAGLLAIDAAVLPNMPGRPLTPGEKTFLHEVYKNSVDYDKIRINQSAIARAYLSFTDATAETKGNVIFFEATPGVTDLSKTDDTYLKYTFVHEGGHVWQGQSGIMPGPFSRMAATFTRFASGDKHEDYRYSVLEGKDLLKYNTEQQASIITKSWFSSHKLLDPLFDSDTKATPEQLKAGYDATLKNFNANPAYPKQGR